MIDWQTLEPGQYRLNCPACGRTKRSDKTLGVTVTHDGAGVAHCFRCEFVESYRPERNSTRTKAPQRPAKAPQAPERFETLSDHGRALWDACRPLPGTDGAAYLAARGCALPPEYGDLRFHPALRHPATGYTGPALVGRITHAETAEPISLHRTWVRADGTKALEADPPRLLLGNHRKAGGVVRLWPDDEVGTHLGIAEGIETSLSLAHAFQPVWAAIDAGNLATMPALRGIRVLCIAADHDDAGIKAARACGDRWARAGVAVSIAMPPTPRQDLNDLGRAAA